MHKRGKMKVSEDFQYLATFHNKDEILQQIITLGFDYDGFENSTSLKVLIDELVELAQYGLTLEK
jgi:hypothetical protein